MSKDSAQSLYQIASDIYSKPLNASEIQSKVDKLNSFFNSGSKPCYAQYYSIAQQMVLDLQNREMTFENLKKLKSKYESSDSYNINVGKFIDYLELEISRKIDLESEIESISSETHDLSRKLEQSKDDVDSINQDYAKIKSEIEESSSRSITILSIFAGIVVAFMGGFTLLGNSLAALDNSVSKYRLFFMITLIGFVLYNIIISLMFIVCRINGKDIGVQCKLGYACSDYGCKKYKENKILRNTLCQSLNKYPYIFGVDIMMIYIMYFIFVLWAYSKNNSDIFIEIFESFPWLKDWYCEIAVLLIPVVLFLLVVKVLLRNNKKESDYE